MLQSRRGRNKQATGTFRKVVAISPKSAEAHLNLGMAQADQFSRERALAEFTEAAQLSPDLGAAHYSLSDVQTRGLDCTGASVFQNRPPGFSGGVSKGGNAGHEEEDVPRNNTE